MCSAVDCAPSASLESTIEGLRRADAVDLQLTSVSMCYSNESYPNYPLWAPVKHDGTFFRFDAEDKLHQHGFPSDITYVIGTNSFEGNQYYQYDRELSYENLDSIFEITNGFEEGKATVARRYKFIEKEDQQRVLDKYFEVHQELLGVDKLEDIDEEGAKLIAGFIYGDLGYRLPAYEQSLIYRKV